MFAMRVACSLRFIAVVVMVVVLFVAMMVAASVCNSMLEIVVEYWYMCLVLLPQSPELCLMGLDVVCCKSSYCLLEDD